MLNRVYINLKNIKSNALKIKKKLPAETKFCAVVKADAYGHGASKVANTLYNIVDCFAVATVEEGIELRLSGIAKEILVLTKPFKSDLSRAVYYDLTLTVDNITTLKQIVNQGKTQNKTVKIHIKYDTGMNRQGVKNLNELKSLLEQIKKSKWVKLCGFYSHYAKPQDKRALKKATNEFLLAIKLVKGYNNNIICHISASGGFLRNQYFEMVRIGILLYGYTPFPTDKIKVKPAMKIVAPIISNRTLYKGEKALYDLKKTSKKRNLSLIRYGYADGLERKSVGGVYNNRCMDLSLVENDRCRARTYTVLDDAEKLAKKYGTISYEILVKSGFRAEKKYIL